MPEEIFQKCAHCGRVFNYEWGGWRQPNGKYVCSNEQCQKKMQAEKNKNAK